MNENPFPFFHYVGSKKKKVPLLLSLMPEFGEYREVFAGSAVVYGAISPTIPRWINDPDPMVFGLLQTFRDDPILLERMLDVAAQITGENTARPLFTRFKRQLELDQCPLAYWAISMMAVGCWVRYRRKNLASTHARLLHPGRWTSVTRERLEAARALLQDTRITAWDYRRVLEAPGNNVLLYLDPPYPLDDHGSPLYNYILSDEEHEELFERLTRCQHRFIMNLNRHMFTLKLYARRDFTTPFRKEPGFRIVREQFVYTSIPQQYNGGDARKKRTVTELIIMNY